MLYELTQWLQHVESGFRVFNYLTFRAILSTLTALTFCFIFGPWLIRKLTFHQIGQVVRDDGYISVKRATRNALNAPNERQSRLV